MMRATWVDGSESSVLMDFSQLINDFKPDTVVFVSAFTSVGGVDQVKKLLEETTGIVGTHALLSGTDRYVTHPDALSLATDSGWEVRMRRGGSGIFHMKAIIGAAGITREGVIEAPSFAWLGSANLTGAGLKSNSECGLATDDAEILAALINTFGTSWDAGTPAEGDALEEYAKQFAEANRKRDNDILEALGLREEEEGLPNSRELSVTQRYASAAWTGLESFTGDYAFQVEFPQAAALVLERIVGGVRGQLTPVDFVCDDGQVREMKCGFYVHNHMYRINVPNDTPGVDWARDNETGLALVEEATGTEPYPAFQIVRPGERYDRIVRRSRLLGSHGSTTVRDYGWY